MALAYLTINLDAFTGDDHPPISQYSTITLDPGADHIDTAADVIHVRTIVVSLDRQGKAATANGVPCVDGRVPIVAGIAYAVSAPNVLRGGPHYVPALTAGQVIDLSDLIVPGTPITPDQASVLAAHISDTEAALAQEVTDRQGADAAHVAAVDPHPQYATTAEAAAAAPVQSVAGKTGAVTLAAADVGAATAAQGVKADTAVQPAALAGYVATTDPRLSDARTPTAHTHPVAQVSDSTTTGRALLTAVDAAAARTALGLGTAATTAATAYATAAQGAKADTAIQPITVLDYIDPLPQHTYIDAWTSPVFDDGRNVWVPGQPVAVLTATAPAPAGATTLTVSITLTPGMSLVTVPATATGQVMRVQSVAGSTVTLVAPLRHPIASGQRLDPLWQNASHLSASSGATLSGFAALASYVAERCPTVTASKVTILGNSWVSMGSLQWGNRLGAKYPGATIVNAGAGSNTTQMLARFTTDVPTDSDVIVLFEWVNDTYQSVSPATQAANWRELVTRARAITPHVVVVGPVPLNEHPNRALAQEHAATARAGTTLETLQLRRTVDDLASRLTALETP